MPARKGNVKYYNRFEFLGMAGHFSWSLGWDNYPQRRGTRPVCCLWLASRHAGGAASEAREPAMVAPLNGEREGPLEVREGKLLGQGNGWQNASHCGWLTAYRMPSWITRRAGGLMKARQTLLAVVYSLL
jgi:hypothetical protein